MTDRRGLILAVGSLLAAAVVFLAATGPNPATEASGPIRRAGGACLQLERWTITGWQVVGQSYSVGDIRDGIWHDAVDPPPCTPGISQQIYMIRPPFDAPVGIYRLRGLDDSNEDLEFRRIEFVPGPPGP